MDPILAPTAPEYTGAPCPVAACVWGEWRCQVTRTLVLAAFLALGATQPAPVAAAEDPVERSITVQGTGSVLAKPDTAEVLAGVVTMAEAASKALAANNAAAAKLFKVLAGFGVAQADIQTRSFSVSPQYDRRETGRLSRRIVGYRVVNQLSVMVRDLSRLGRLLDALVGDGANSLGGVRFSIEEPAPFGDRARKEAMADARRKAELYAAAAGVKVGRVLRIAELDIRTPQPGLLRATTAANMAAVPVAPGEHEVSATVTVTYGIE